MQSSASKNNSFLVNTYPAQQNRGVLFFVLLLMLSAILIGACRKTEISGVSLSKNYKNVSPEAVNLNTATVSDLEKLPHIGTETARTIVAFREKHGDFRRAENLILIDGMSDKKFREIQHLVKVE